MHKCYHEKMNHIGDREQAWFERNGINTGAPENTPTTSGASATDRQLGSLAAATDYGHTYTTGESRLEARIGDRVATVVGFGESVIKLLRALSPTAHPAARRAITPSPRRRVAPRRAIT